MLRMKYGRSAPKVTIIISCLLPVEVLGLKVWVVCMSGVCHHDLWRSIHERLVLGSWESDDGH
jgi:hypothetical protein